MFCVVSVIVKALITSADELGRVPEEVGVAASNLKLACRRVSETQSLDDMLSEGSPKEKKQRTSSLSGRQ